MPEYAGMPESVYLTLVNVKAILRDGLAGNTMNVNPTLKAARMRTGVVALFLASSVALYGQHDKPKPSKPAPPARQSAPARSSPPAAASHPNVHTPQRHQESPPQNHAT